MPVNMAESPPAARRIAHLDMDAFFASVTLLRYPQLRDLPMVIGGSRMSAQALVMQIDALHPGHGYAAQLARCMVSSDGVHAPAGESGTGGPAESDGSDGSDGSGGGGGGDAGDGAQGALLSATAPDIPDATPALEALLARIDPAHFPRLQGYRGRGVTTTATYAARAFGLGSGMGLTRAARLCPQAILLPIDFDRYRAYSRRFKAIILSEAPVMEDRGIDEVFIDLSALPGVQADGGRAVAAHIQARIQAETGLSCSIGVAPNKLLAKMASDFDKPHGISILYPEDLQARIWPLPCRLINGIGPRTDARLRTLGVETIGQLAARPLSWLTQHFGVRTGQWLHEVAWGRDERPVADRGEPVSISRETTFERDLHAVHDRALLGTLFTELAQKTAQDLERKGYVGRTVGIKLRYADFRTVTRDLTVREAVWRAEDIRRLAGQCLKRVDLSQRMRLLGIRVASLERRDTPRPPPEPENLELEFFWSDP